MKYRGLYKRKFDVMQTDARIRYYEESICISFSHLTQRVAREVGTGLVNAMVCQRFETEWNGETSLWLYEVDFAFLDGFGGENDLAGMIAEFCREYGYEVTGTNNL